VEKVSFQVPLADFELTSSTFPLLHFSTSADVS
jgi:hypothetical protein